MCGTVPCKPYSVFASCLYWNCTYKTQSRHRASRRGKFRSIKRGYRPELSPTRFAPWSLAPQRLFPSNWEIEFWRNCETVLQYPLHDPLKFGSRFASASVCLYSHGEICLSVCIRMENQDARPTVFHSNRALEKHVFCLSRTVRPMYGVFCLCLPLRESRDSDSGKTCVAVRAGERVFPKPESKLLYMVPHTEVQSVSGY